MKTNIAILGVGLVGGSLALSLKQSSETLITGFDVDQIQLAAAQERGAIDRGTTQLAEAVVDADFIFLCAPVGKLYELISFLRYTPLKKGAIISDTGSAKSSIVEFAGDFYEKGVHFIGGHPMAGSHKTGVEAAHDRLFENAYWVLTPLPQTPTEKVEDLVQLLSLTKAHIVQMDSQKHDRVVGAISHFPHIVASALVNQVAGYDDEHHWYQRLAAGGFRDITRIASSNPQMWSDILLNNREVLMSLIGDWQRMMEQIHTLLKEKNAPEIFRFFQNARMFRDELPERRKGAITPIYDLYVDIPDMPGEIGKITMFLGEKEISITNIKVLEVREDIMGVLQISFRNDADMERAKACLTERGYTVYTAE